jgi:hypothetical protein
MSLGINFHLVKTIKYTLYFHTFAIFALLKSHKEMPQKCLVKFTLCRIPHNSISVHPLSLSIQTVIQISIGCHVLTTNPGYKFGGKESGFIINDILKYALNDNVSLQPKTFNDAIYH